MRRSPSIPTDAPPGIALPMVLLVLLVLAALAAGLVFVAGQERLVETARLEQVQARLAAQSAVRSALALWSSAQLSDLSPGRTRSLAAAAGSFPGGAEYRASVWRLNAAQYLLIGAGSSRPVRGAVARSGLLVTAADAVGILRSVRAALSLVGTADIDATIRTDSSVVGAGDCPLPDSAAPVPPLAAILLRDTLAVTWGDAAEVRGAPGVVVDPAWAGDAPTNTLGGFTSAAFPQVADMVEEGTLQPGPALTVDGQCARGSTGNWGAPDDPSSPCADYYPLIYAPGDLVVNGGAGQGILVVSGHLDLGGGASFHGLILVGGELQAAAPFHVAGAIQVRGSGRSYIGGGTLQLDLCALARALLRSPGLDRAAPRRPRAWVAIY